jgi:outer membrane protein OmpA-like peptidoglycan-associated protein
MGNLDRRAFLPLRGTFRTFEFICILAVCMILAALEMLGEQHVRISTAPMVQPTEMTEPEPVMVTGNISKTATCCVVNFLTPASNPPQVSCSTNPSTVQSGVPSTITASASSPDGAQIASYSYTSNGGRISGTGTTATLDTAGAGAGPVTVTVTAIQFPDLKSPWRVDTTAKAILDDLASKLKNDPNAKIVIVGYADGEKAPMEETGKNRHPMNLAAQRAVNAKAYLVQQQSIDPNRVEVRTATSQQKAADIVWVPQGADENTCTDLQNTTPVDKSTVKSSEDAYPKNLHWIG